MTGIKQHDTVSWALHPDQSDSKDIMLHLAPKQPLCDKCEKMCWRERKRRLLWVQKTLLPPLHSQKGS